MADFRKRFRYHVLSVNSESKHAKVCKYGSLICFPSRNSILIGSCRFQIQFQGPYTLGNWNDEYRIILYFQGPFYFFTGVKHPYVENVDGYPLVICDIAIENGP